MKKEPTNCDIQGIISRAFSRALKTLCKEHGVSNDALDVFVRIHISGEPAKSVAARYGITADDAYAVAHRVLRILGKHGLDGFNCALRQEGWGDDEPTAPVAA